MNVKGVSRDKGRKEASGSYRVCSLGLDRWNEQFSSLALTKAWREKQKRGGGREGPWKMPSTGPSCTHYTFHTVLVLLLDEHVV